MQTITQTRDTSQLLCSDFPENYLFFDIETTGFSPNSAFVYLIGCAWRTGEVLYLTQYLADKREEEPELLKTFLEKISSFHTLVSFNGLGFDLPFLKGRMQKCGLSHSLDDLCYIDLFKDLSSLKNLILLENHKQKTVEQFLGIRRGDRYNGGELIPVYKQYSTSGDRELLNILLLHNCEDVLGIAGIYSIRRYEAFFRSSFQVTDIKVHQLPKGMDPSFEDQFELFCTFQSPVKVPKELHSDHAGFFVSIGTERSQIRLPIFHGEVKFFYENYSEYYYLPAEDRAIHKSVSSFVDNAYREKCKAYNCYLPKDGFFLPQLKEVFSPAYRRNYKDKISYFDMTPEFFTDSDKVEKYIHAVLDWVRFRDLT